MTVQPRSTCHLKGRWYGQEIQQRRRLTGQNPIFVDPKNALKCKIKIKIKIDQKSIEKSACQEGGCAAYLTKDGKPLVTGRMCNLCNGHRSRDTCEACEIDSIGHSIFYFLMGITFVFGLFLLADMLFRKMPSLSIVYPGFQHTRKRTHLYMWDTRTQTHTCTLVPRAHTACIGACAVACKHK